MYALKPNDCVKYFLPLLVVKPLPHFSLIFRTSPKTSHSLFAPVLNHTLPLSESLPIPPPLSGPLLRRRVYVNFVIISGLFWGSWANLWFFIILCVYVLSLEVQLSEGWDPINQFHPSNFCVPAPIQDLHFHRRACLLCWYWWNCWLSLFRFSL